MKTSESFRILKLIGKAIQEAEDSPLPLDFLSSICESFGVKGHIAVMTPDYIEKILSGEKTMESRYGKTRAAPYKRVRQGEIVLLKESTGPVKAVAWVSDVSYHGPMKGTAARTLMREHQEELALDRAFIEAKKNSRYATLIRFASVLPIEGKRICKSDRRPWVVLGEIKPKDARNQTQLTLFPVISNCQKALHTYHRSKRLNRNGFPVCSVCGTDTIDWNRLHHRDPADFEYLVVQLKTDVFRHEWWQKPIDRRAINHALRKGRRKLREAALRRLRKSVGEVHAMRDGSLRPYRDGYQTPFSGNSIYYAQHALACCCRECIAIWHGIPNGRDLTPSELAYFLELILRYVQVRIPELQEDGVYVPPIRHGGDQ